MAEKLESFEFRKGGPGGKYPWREWLDGSIWSLTRGEDFEVQPANFRLTAGMAALRNGKKVRTNVDGDRVIIQAYED